MQRHRFIAFATSRYQHNVCLRRYLNKIDFENSAVRYCLIVLGLVTRWSR